MPTTHLNIRRCIVLLSAVSALAVVPLLVAAQSTTTAPASAPAPLVPAPKAIAYYDAACRRCHGPEGSFYGPDLGKGLSDDALRHVIDDMARGPAQEPLDDAGLAAQTAFHRAIMASTPYVSVTQIKGTELAGEVMTDTKITAAAPSLDKPLAATVNESEWKLTLPPAVKLADVTLTAERNGKKTTLPLSGSAYFSHNTPLPASPKTK